MHTRKYHEGGNVIKIRVMLAGVLLAIAGLLAACGGGGGSSTPSLPPTVDVTGKWEGSGNSNYGSGYLSMILSQNGSSVSGTFVDSSGSGGTTSGTVSANILSFTLSPTGCTGTLTGTGIVATNATSKKQQIDTTYTGTYTCSGKSYNESGVGTVVKQ